MKRYVIAKLSVTAISILWCSLFVKSCSCCKEPSLGSQLEVHKIKVDGDPYHMVADLAIPGNILIQTDKGNLYTTDTISTVQLNTQAELNIWKIPEFVQTSGSDIIYLVKTKLSLNHIMQINLMCLCHINRKTKHLASIESHSYMQYMDCSLPCYSVDRNNTESASGGLNMDFDIVPSRFLTKIDEDQRERNFVFTVGYADGLEITFYDLSSNTGNLSSYLQLPNDGLNNRTQRSRPTSYSAKLPNSPTYDKAITCFMQDNSSLYISYHQMVLHVDLPSITDIRAGNGGKLFLTIISGDKELDGSQDGPFDEALYYSISSLVKINSTTIAAAGPGNNKIRLLDMSTNTTSSISVSTASQSGGHLSGLSTMLFMNDSLYVGWQNILGRIYHKTLEVTEDSDDTTQTDVKETIISVSTSASTLVIIVAAVATTIVACRKRSKYTSRYNLTQKRTQAAVNRPLPSIAGLHQNGKEECCDTQDDIYDMIGDQYYETVTNQRPSLNDYESAVSNSDDNTGYVDRCEIFVSEEVCQVTSDLDKYGYLKPQHDLAHRQ